MFFFVYRPCLVFFFRYEVCCCYGMCCLRSERAKGFVLNKESCSESLLFLLQVKKGVGSLHLAEDLIFFLIKE